MTKAPRASHRMPSALRRVGTFAMIALVATAGLLIWGRLRLVTGVPRTALAEPRQPVADDPSTRPLPASDGRSPSRDLDERRDEAAAVESPR